MAAMPQHTDNSLAAMGRRLRQRAIEWRAAGGPSWRVHPSAPAPEGAHLPAGERPRTTAEATILPIGRGRYRRLGWAPGEPHVVRTDLGAVPTPGRSARRRSLLYVGQHTDVHVCDAQSPARLEGGETFGWFNPGADAGHRPQELCTTHVLDQLVVATNAVAASPVTGAEMAWCAQTGDNTDNRTAAELGWWLDVLGGREVTPNTGAPGRYEGVQRSGWRGVWHPDDPTHDIYGAVGFPHLPGFLDAAIRPFQPTGLEVPWVAVFGNHDVIYQGTFGDRVARIGDLLAASGAKPRGHVGLVRSNLHARLAGTDPARWEGWGRRGPGIQHVTPDPEARRAVALDAYLARMVADGDHGFTSANVEDRTTWWSRPEGEHVQVIGLDTCNHAQGSGGSMGPRQTAWLEEELVRVHRRWVGPDGRWVDGDAAATDRLVVLLSHHNSWTMDNRLDDPLDPGPRTLGPDLVALLARFPNVVLWINGHCHEHKVLVHRGRRAGSGCWEVDTISGIDFGQQARTFELLDNGDGTLSILVTVVDHAAPPAVDHRSDDGWSPVELASLSRELAANDARWIDPISLLGGPEDRNVELVVAAPFPLR